MPPLKAKPAPGKTKTKTQTVAAASEGWRLPYFDIYKHGYRMVRGQLVYRKPDGTQVPATGVDSFGPFPDSWRKL
jgi:hypothetical protein